MMRNRIADFMESREHDCPHCRAKRVQENLQAEWDRIEAIIGEDVLNLWLPTVAELAGEDSEDDDESESWRGDPQKSVVFTLIARPARIPIGEPNIVGFVVSELRRLAGMLTDTADKLDGGPAGRAVKA